MNLGRLQQAVDAGKLDAAKTVTEAALVEAGVIKSVRDGVRILGKGDLKAKLTIEISGASKGAIEAVEKAGGSVTVTAVAKKDSDGPKKARSKKAAKEAKGTGGGDVQESDKE